MYYCNKVTKLCKSHKRLKLTFQSDFLPMHFITSKHNAVNHELNISNISNGFRMSNSNTQFI